MEDLLNYLKISEKPARELEVSSADPLMLSLINDNAMDRSEASMLKTVEKPGKDKDPLEDQDETRASEMSGFGLLDLEDSNDSDMAENLVVSDNEGKFFSKWRWGTLTVF